jgi:microcystin-dependent protein
MTDPNFFLFNVTLPVGSIIAFAGNVESFKKSQQSADSPVIQPIEAFGWMLCDGSSLNASEYTELYAVLGNLYGSSESGNDIMFNLPDLRGQFLRGIGTDQASLEDRIAAPGGTPSGVGSIQKDALQTHQHVYIQPTGTPAPGQNGAGTATVNANAYTGKPSSETDPSSIKVSQYETRPVNVFVNYLIKYTYRLPSFNQNI